MSVADRWWLMYTSIVAIKAHPRNEGGPDLDECALLTDQAMERYYKRFPEG